MQDTERRIVPTQLDHMILHLGAFLSRVHRRDFITGLKVRFSAMPVEF